MEIEERIRLGYERFNRRDWDSIARGLPETFEVIDHLDEQRGTGPNAFREVTTANGDLAFEDLRMEPVEIKVLPEQGNRVAVLVRIHASASGGASGVPVDSELAQIWTFERGVPARFEQFRTWDEAAAAAAAQD